MKTILGVLGVFSLIALWIGMMVLIGNSEQAMADARRAAKIEENKKSQGEWAGGVYTYTDPRSGQRYLIVSTGSHGGVTMIKAEPDKLPEAK